ncbi:MAG: T9SS type A sorting domain-containing protein [Bacteroidales bacterium]
MNLTLAENEKLSFELINMQGVVIPMTEKVVYHQRLNDIKFDVSNFSNGVYFLRGLGEKSVFLKRLLFRTNNEITFLPALIEVCGGG